MVRKQYRGYACNFKCEVTLNIFMVTNLMLIDCSKNPHYIGKKYNP